MATGPLRFRTPYIEELPVAHSRQAPGFAWVAVAGPPSDPSNSWGTTNRKRQRHTAAGTDSQREAQTARQQREVERKLRELNNEGTRDVAIPVMKREKSGAGAGGGAPVRAGKTPNTKKILASGKTFAHYLDDEEAEITRTGRRDVDVDVGPAMVAATTVVASTQRASKTPIVRRKASLLREESSISASPAPAATHALSDLPTEPTDVDMEGDDGDGDGDIAPLPTQAEMDALLNALPLTYNQARSAPPPASAPPPRRFCEICGYWGRVKCMKCGNMTCSVACKATHEGDKCLKFYA